MREIAETLGISLGSVHALLKACCLSFCRPRAAARGADLTATVREMQANGATSLGGLARALTEAGIPTARGASTWSPMQVSRLLATMEQRAAG